MDTDLTGNPYRPGDPLSPFAGRQAELARLDQYLKDPAPNHAMVFLGRRWTGKTALLLHFDSVFDDLYLAIYLPLKTLAPASENDLLEAIMAGTAQALAQRDITITRLPAPEADLPILRGWFAETWLPGVFQIIRAHRRLVLLVDDAQLWLDAERGEDWPGDTFDFFHDLLKDHPQFRLVLTFLAEREEDLPGLKPLVNPARVLRLSHLPADATQKILRHPGLYTVQDDSAEAVQRATGGHPQLVQRFAAHIYQYQYAHPDASVITPELVRALLPGVYTASVEELTSFWAESTDTEQLVLLAISRLRYDDPLQPITADLISTWLIDSDFPLDRTAVNAALRRLEYRELIAHRGAGVELTCHLMQTWLLENGPRTTAEGTAFRLPRRVIFAALAVVVLAVLLLINLSNTPQPAVTTTAAPVPTVTLAEQAAEF